MTHYLIIADMPEEYHLVLKHNLKVLNNLGYGNHLRELRIYEVTINNENEKWFDDFFSCWHNSIAFTKTYNIFYKLVMFFLSLIFRHGKVMPVKTKPQFNMRNLVVKIRDKYKTVPDLL
jgi:hypothetical protein